MAVCEDSFSHGYAMESESLHVNNKIKQHHPSTLPYWENQAEWQVQRPLWLKFVNTFLMVRNA